MTANRHGSVGKSEYRYVNLVTGRILKALPADYEPSEWREERRTISYTAWEPVNKIVVDDDNGLRWTTEPDPRRRR